MNAEVEVVSAMQAPVVSVKLMANDLLKAIMRGDGKTPVLAVLDKAIMAALKASDWDLVSDLVAELHLAILNAEASKADANWNAPAQPQALSATLPEKRLGWAIAEGMGGDPWFADIPTGTGLLGDKLGRSLDLAHVEGEAICFYAFKVHFGGEEIYKGLRDFLVNSVLYRAFLEAPRQFGYNTERSPLRLDGLPIRWELVGPKDLINPRKTEMRWGEKDVWGMQRAMKGLGVESFSLGRLQAEAEALQANLSKDNFSGPRARQWFENRVSVVIA